MDYRWKNRGGNLPNVQPNFVDPQGVRATIAQQQMAGYQPTPQVATPNPQGPSRSPVQPNSGEGYQFDSSGIDQFNAKKEKLATLKGQLATIDGKLAELKATAPDDEKAIAAKLMEIGDTSLYQGILARQQNQAAQQKSNASAIDNMLYDAEKVMRGLTAAETAEQRAMYRSTLEGTLREAKEVGAKLGIDATQHPSYKRIEAELAGASDSAGAIGDMTDRLNKWQAKITDETFSDADRAEVEKLRNDKTNSQFFKQLDDILAKTKGKTKEDRDRGKAYAAKRKADALDLYYSLNGLDPEAAAKRIANLTPRERKLLEDFYPEMLK